MVELRVIEGGLDAMPGFLLGALVSVHTGLADICEDMAACLDACPPEKAEAFLAAVRKRLRQMVPRFLEDLDDVMPEAAALTKAMRTHVRLCVRDLIKAGPDPAAWRLWRDVHQGEAKRLSR